MSRTVTIDDVNLHLSHPDELPMKWVGQKELMDQVQAAWLVVDPDDLPLNPRLIGKPGVGKTTLAYAAAKQLKREVYMFQATMDTRPEDLLVTPVISEAGKIQYVASSIVTAMIRGVGPPWRHCWIAAGTLSLSWPGSKSRPILTSEFAPR